MVLFFFCRFFFAHRAKKNLQKKKFYIRKQYTPHGHICDARIYGLFFANIL